MAEDRTLGWYWLRAWFYSSTLHCPWQSPVFAFAKLTTTTRGPGARSCCPGAAEMAWLCPPPWGVAPGVMAPITSFLQPLA